MKCLDNIIGLTKSDCDCFVQNVNEDELAAARLSVSGLYMDELEGALSIRAIQNNTTACRSLYGMMKQAVEVGKQETMDGVILGIQELNQQSKDSYTGQIGQLSASQSLSVTGPFVGQRWRGNHTDGIIRIKKIQIYLDKAITGTLKIIRAVKYDTVGEEVASIPFTSVPNTITAIPFPTGTTEILLPLRYGSDEVDYYIVYDRQTALPKNNRLSCNCGRSEYALDNFFYREGITMASTASLDIQNGTPNANGLIFDVDVRCSTIDFICREYMDDDGISVAFAHAVRFRANWWLNEEVLKGDQLNRYAVMNREYMWGKRNHYKSEWEKRITWIARNIDMTSTDCFICRNQEIYFAGIYA